jgi:restriction endonuclease S subunit
VYRCSTLGKIALSYEECITNQQINAIICENFKVNPFFVYYFLLKNQGLLKAYAGTTTKPIVKKSLLETFQNPPSFSSRTARDCGDFADY